MEKMEELKYRFLGKVKRNEETGCLDWQYGKRTGKPYGQFWMGGALGFPLNMAAHRAAWELFQGPIPEGKQLLHKCNNGSCCETNIPGHLYLGDHIQNMRDRDESGRTSKGERRYNFKRSPDLVEKVMSEFRAGKKAKEICIDLSIGWTTLFRLKDQSPELANLMAQTAYNRRAGKRGPQRKK